LSNEARSLNRGHSI